MELPDKLIQNNIKKGSVLFSDYFKKTQIKHSKYFVVLNVTKDAVVGFFFINSFININKNSKPAFYAMQIPIKSENNDFLEHDSYINATEIQKPFTIDQLTDSIKKGETRYVGELNKKDMEFLLEKARTSKLFDKIEKDTFF